VGAFHPFAQLFNALHQPGGLGARNAGIVELALEIFPLPAERFGNAIQVIHG
jgi:hypothetical protein